MNLDQLLSTMSIDQLRKLAAAWAPDESLSSSKQGLFRALRDRMIQPDHVRRCLDGCSRLERGVVRKLLRTQSLSQSVVLLAAGSANQVKSVMEVREAVEELARKGLVQIEAEKRWEVYGSAKAAVPRELVGPLRAATGIDERSSGEVLGLAEHLAGVPADTLAARLKALGLSIDPNTPADRLAAELSGADPCRGRIASLSPRLREIVLAVVGQRGGIVPVQRLDGLGLTLPRIGEKLLGRWRAELEAAFIGTVGDISLLDYGIDLDGRMLVVFGEVAESLLSAPPEGDASAPDTVGPDFLLDLQELVSQVREYGSRLKASGALTRAAADRLIERMNRKSLPRMSADTLLELRLACAEKMGLIERLDDSLAVRPEAWRWERRSYEEKAGDLFGLIGFAVPTPRSKHHHEGLCAAARELMRAMRPGEWRRAGSLVSITLRRYLARLDESGLRDRIAAAVQEVSQYVLPPFPMLEQLSEDLKESVLAEAHALGVVDVAFDGDRAAGERLSAFGAQSCGVAPGEETRSKLITGADFEVIILPEGDATRLRYEVGQFAAAEKFEQTYHLRITQERVEEAVVRGFTADEMIGVLRAHSETGSLPQNVEFSIRAWAERVHVASVEEVRIFELGSAALLDLVAELPEMKSLTVRRVSPTALALSGWPSDRKLLADLRRLGVHVR